MFSFSSKDDDGLTEKHSFSYQNGHREIHNVILLMLAKIIILDVSVELSYHCMFKKRTQNK